MTKFYNLQVESLQMEVDNLITVGFNYYSFYISIKRLQYEFTTYTTLEDYYTIQLYNTTGNDTPRSKRL